MADGRAGGGVVAEHAVVPIGRNPKGAIGPHDGAVVGAVQVALARRDERALWSPGLAVKPEDRVAVEGGDEEVAAGVPGQAGGLGQSIAGDEGVLEGPGGGVVADDSVVALGRHIEQAVGAEACAERALDVGDGVEVSEVSAGGEVIACDGVSAEVADQELGAARGGGRGQREGEGDRAEREHERSAGAHGHPSPPSFFRRGERRAPGEGERKRSTMRRLPSEYECSNGAHDSPRDADAASSQPAERSSSRTSRE